MLPKILRLLSSSIENRIVASFNDAAIEPEPFVRQGMIIGALEECKFFLKRIFDVVMSTILLCISSPIFLVITILIKATSKGAVFFKQERIGLKGKKFQIYKFRTMNEHSSEEEHREYIQYLLKESEKADNRVDLLTGYIAHVNGRVTKIGKFLRATSLDELPQLINIFLGQMSLVGPRPHPVYEVKEYKSWYCRRLDVKPGLTGWSKLNLRNTPQNYEEAILYDLWYVDHWTLTLDLRIILMTVPFILLMRDVH